MRDQVQTAKLLFAIPLFAGVPLAALREMAALGRRGAFKAGAPIFMKGQRSEYLYVVLSGRVSAGASSLQGHVLFHRILQVGDLFGEIGVLDGGARTASAVAQEATEILTIPRKVFLQLLEHHPTVSRRMLEMLAHRLRSTSQMLEDTLFLSARDRVGRRLLELAGELGPIPPSGVVLHQTQEELGSMVGLTRQHVSSQLSWMRSEGLLKTGHGRIIICDARGLAALCGLSAGDPTLENRTPSDRSRLSRAGRGIGSGSALGRTRSAPRAEDS